MDATFNEVLCPHCGGRMSTAHVQMGDDILVTKACDPCKKTIVILVPNEKYTYIIDRKEKPVAETAG
jgi:hypothetical protein